MEDPIIQIKNLFNTVISGEWEEIHKIPQSGGDRIYFRIHQGGQSWIATVSLNIKENQTFIYFAQHFKAKGLPVPEVLAINKEGTCYIQEDVGTTSLLEVLEKEGKTDHVFSLFKKSLKSLAELQVKGHQGLDYQQCLTSKIFGNQSIMSDLLYYKYYFLDSLQYP